MEALITAENLTRRFGHVEALKEASISLHAGDIYGLVGPNGAGKSTLMRILAGIDRQQSGNIRYFGDVSLKEAQRRIGVMIDPIDFFPYMTGKENLIYFAKVAGIVDKGMVDSVLSMVDLKNVRTKVKGYSLGMRQRLGLARALLGRPEVLLLDEPVNGIDPEGVVALRHFLEQLAKVQGVAILISSHILGELSQLATCYSFMRKGRIVDTITAEALKNLSGNGVRVRADQTERAAQVLDARYGADALRVLEDGSILIRDVDASEVGAVLFEAGVRLHSLEVHRESLEEYYLTVMKGGQQ